MSVARLISAASPADAELHERQGNESVRNEAVVALGKGISWLKSRQNPDGSWQGEARGAASAATALAALFQGERITADFPDSTAVERAAAYIRRAAKRDGTIGDGPDVERSTSLCATALSMQGNPADAPAIARSHRYLVSRISVGVTTSLVTYTSMLEAVAGSGEKSGSRAPQMDWKAVSMLVKRCQFPVVDGDRRGGAFFDAAPAASRKSANAPPSGLAACAGTLALRCAHVPETDPGMRAALAWIARNFTVRENPGGSGANYYLYLEYLAKALSGAHGPIVRLPDGREVDWPKAMVLQLIDVQNSDGSWPAKVPQAGAESASAITTARALLALEISMRRL